MVPAGSLTTCTSGPPTRGPPFPYLAKMRLAASELSRPGRSNWSDSALTEDCVNATATTKMTSQLKYTVLRCARTQRVNALILTLHLERDRR